MWDRKLFGGCISPPGCWVADRVEDDAIAYIGHAQVWQYSALGDTTSTNDAESEWMHRELLLIAGGFVYCTHKTAIGLHDGILPSTNDIQYNS
jgi:hypothetical protein